MKAGLVIHNGKPTVLIETPAARVDFSRALQAYRLIQEDRPTAPVQSIQELIQDDLLTPGFIEKVLLFTTRHGLMDTFTLPAPVSYLQPLRPGLIISLGRNYAGHAVEIGAAPPEEPILFAKSPTACIGDGEAIIVRESYGRVDYEAELAFVIGRRAKYVAEEEAQDYIAGYTLMNDVTARGLQQADTGRGLPWFRAKSIDTFCPLGPVIALPDAFPWPVEVDLTLRVNGEIRQQANTRQFLFSIPRVLSFITRYVTLSPGDIVSTGTPAGVGPMAPGDQIEIEAPGIGILRNFVAPAGARVMKTPGES